MNAKTTAKERRKAARNIVRITLGSAQTIRDVARLRAELDGLLERASRVEFDGGALERVDTAFLQLLTAFSRDAAKRGIEVSWQSAAPELVRVSALLGLSQALDIKTVA